jgi:transglutaminase-like putative cysteine protease
MLLTGQPYDAGPTPRYCDDPAVNDLALRRTVTAHLEIDVVEPALLALQIAVAGPVPDERLTITRNGEPVPVREVAAGHGGRAHVWDSSVGPLVIDYEARVVGVREVPHEGESDLLEYRRPSRYCPSDKLLAIAAAEFDGITGGELVTAVGAWVYGRLFYTGGSSGPTDDAIDTLLLGAGVCRDFAHLTLALLRARDVPARLAAVYAPGLSPMDFHAVVEAWVDGAWRLVDATRLAPRSSLLRIATGRDAADTAFLTTHGGIVNLTGIAVTATADPFPNDPDPAAVVVLG